MKNRLLLSFGVCASLLACSGDSGSPASPSSPNNPGADGGAATSDGGADPVELPLGPGVSTLAGASESGAEDGARGDARFNNPVNTLVAPDGRILVADYDNGRVRVLRPDGQTATLVRQPNFSRPFGMVFAADGTLYVETDANDMGGRSFETGTIWRVGADGAATPLVRDIGRPRGLAALPDGRIAMSDPEHHILRVFDPRTMQVTDLAGAENMPGYADGAGAEARFNRPYDIVLAGDRLIVADQNNHRLRAVTLAGAVSTVAGDGMMGSTDGPAMMARFNKPQGLARDAAGNLYVTELGGYVVRRVTAGAMVTTIAGAGRAGFRDGDAMMARFFGLEGIDVTADGAFVYVADGNRGGNDDYHRVRRLATGTVPGGTPGE